MKKKRLTLGFAPTRRTIHGEKAFNLEMAIKMRREIEQKMHDYPVDLITLDFLNDEGLLFHGLDAARAAAVFRDKDVDALFCPHCNFGCEDAVAKLARELQIPLLIWGPGGETVDEQGYRYRDSQCGLFATSKVLMRMGVPFSYITSCTLSDDLFDRGFTTFLRAASAVRAMKKPRIGQISVRPDAFWSVKANEGELLERFGIEIVPITLIELKERFEDALRHRPTGLKDILESLHKTTDILNFSDEYLERVAALEYVIMNWAEEEQLKAAATSCWAPMARAVGISPCFAMSELTDLGLPVTCECDIHGAVTALIARGVAMGESSTFLADVTIRHPDDPNTELFWHCGVFPKSMKKPEAPLALDVHYNRGTPAVGHFELMPGDVTITRFDGANGQYSLLMGHAHTANGPATFGTYGWLKFGHWPKWEHRFIYGPYIHHCVGTYGQYAPALYEACRFIPNVHADPVEPTAEEIERYLIG